MNKAERPVTFREMFVSTWRLHKMQWQGRRLHYVAIALHGILKSLTPYAGIYFSARIIDELAGARDPQRIWQMVVVTLAVTAVMALLTAAAGRLKTYCDGGSYFYQQVPFVEKFMKMDYSQRDRQQTNELWTQIWQNAMVGGWGHYKAHGNFEELIQSLTTIIGAVALSVSLFSSQVPAESQMAVLNHPVFILLMLVVMLMISLVSPWLSTKAEAYWCERVESGKLGNRIFGHFMFGHFSPSCWLDQRIYDQKGLCDSYSEKFPSFTPGSPLAQVAKGVGGLCRGLSGVVSVMFTGVAYAFVCLKALGGAFGVGAVTQYVGAITAMSGGVTMMVKVLGDMWNNTKFLRYAFAFLDIPEDMYKGTLTTEKRSDRKYDVEFRNVSFKYPDSDVWALKNVSFQFRVGEKMAVVGLNGSGKTTFIKLLCRLYEPTEGQILLNGIDIRKYRYDEYMDLFSVVFQDFALTAFSLGENVAAAESYDAEKVRECLQKAGFEERLAAMSRGLQTPITKELSEDGVEVSGGEAQKIALARALYKDAPFIILDEPTAALDPIAEAEIYSRFNEIVGDKTAVYISHRLSSCRFCDQITVFHEGRVVQKGSHEELVKIPGQYQELWNAQAQYYTEDDENT